MDGKFIYVFDTEARDKLLANGFVLLKEDDGNQIYVFNAGDAGSTALFEIDNISFATSNTLTF
jgi:hypothetical protein